MIESACCCENHHQNQPKNIGQEVSRPSCSEIKILLTRTWMNQSTDKSSRYQPLLLLTARVCLLLSNFSHMNQLFSVLTTLLWAAGCLKKPIGPCTKKAHRTSLISVSSVLQKPDTSLRSEMIYVGLTAMYNMPVFIPAFTGTHCDYPQRDGQAELSSLGTLVNIPRVIFPCFELSLTRSKPKKCYWLN